MTTYTTDPEYEVSLKSVS